MEADRDKPCPYMMWNPGQGRALSLHSKVKSDSPPVPVRFFCPCRDSFYGCPFFCGQGEPCPYMVWMFILCGQPRGLSLHGVEVILCGQPRGLSLHGLDVYFMRTGVNPVPTFKGRRREPPSSIVFFCLCRDSPCGCPFLIAD